MKKFKFLSSALILILLVLTALTSCFGSKDEVPSPEENVSLDDIPAYSGKAYIEINGNVPFFTEEDISTKAREEYSELDALGRCGVAFACIEKSTMPTEDREEIGSVTPSGWKYKGVSNNNKYDFVDGSYIYNRCHLIGFQLAGENANEKNLITGTRYLNIEGMLPFENQVADFVKATDMHVLYRVTPIYDGEDLVASGVLLEGYSVEDSGEGIQFCVYAYNVQPGVKINYFTGQNVLSGEALPEVDPEPEIGFDPEGEVSLVINKSSKKFHLASCSSVSKISVANKEEFVGDFEVFLEEYPDHSPCSSCLSDLVLPEEDKPKEEVITYIININTHKYHLPSCSGIPTIAENRVDYTGDIESLLSEYEGFTPCGICKPEAKDNNEE